MESSRLALAQVKPRPRTKAPEERREDLINAAERLFVEQGVGPTTIEQITSGADVAKGTFYLHFASKDDVVEALRVRFTHGLRDYIRAQVAGKAAGDWRGALGSWIEACAIGYLDAVRLHDIVFIEAWVPARGGMTDNIVVDHLAELLQTGIHAKAWPIEDPRFVAVFLFNALHGAVDDAIVREKPVNRTGLVGRLQEYAFRAVGLSNDSGRG